MEATKERGPKKPNGKRGRPAKKNDKKEPKASSKSVQAKKKAEPRSQERVQGPGEEREQAEAERAAGSGAGGRGARHGGRGQPVGEPEILPERGLPADHQGKDRLHGEQAGADLFGGEHGVRGVGADRGVAAALPQQPDRAQSRLPHHRGRPRPGRPLPRRHRARLAPGQEGRQTEGHGQPGAVASREVPN
jgi:hypothetical protein